ncbi:MAG: RND family transporter, partial [Bradymonadaceae bacterium]
MKDAFRHVVARFLRRFVVPRPLPITVVSLIVTLVAGWYVATSWNVSSDLESLLDEDSRAASAMRKLNERVGSTSSMYAVVDSPDTEANLEFARRYAEKLRELPAVTLAHFHNDKTFFENHLLLYFGVDTLERIHQRLASEIKRAKRKANPLFVELDNGNGADKNGTAALEEDLSDNREGLAHNRYKEYLISDDGYSVTILVRFDSNSEGLVETGELVDRVEKVGRQLEPQSYHPNMKLQFGGGMIQRNRQYRSIVADVRLSALATLLGIFLLIAVYFRRLRATALLLTPLIMGAVWTLAVAFGLFGELSTISVFIFAILLGLGIDYGIHLLSRFDEQFAAHQNPVDAVVGAFTQTGLATAIGATTTLMTFLILAFAPSRGLSEFGLVAALGVMCTTTAMFVSLPAMILTWDRTTGGGATQSLFGGSVDAENPTDVGIPQTHWLAGGLAAALALTAGAATLWPDLQFEENLHAIGELTPIWTGDDDGSDTTTPRSNARQRATSRAEHIDEKATQIRREIAPDSFQPDREQTTVGEKYTSATQGQMSSAPTVLLFDSADEARRVYRHLQQKVDNGHYETIRSVNAIYSFLPGTPEEQQSRLTEISELRELWNSEDLSVLPKKDRKRLEPFERSIDVENRVDIRDLPVWTKRLFRETGEKAKPPAEGEPFAYEYSIYVTSTVDGNVGSEARRFLDDLEAARTATDSDFTVASPAAVYVAALDQIRQEGLQLILVALLVILAVVFSGPRPGLTAALPLVFGLAWTLGLAVLAGVRLDMFNVVILPAVIGIGIDDGIHFYMRYLETGRGSLRHTFRTVGSTIVMTSLTSMVGFGGLTLADYHGVRSIGHLAVIGIFVILGLVRSVRK